MSSCDVKPYMGEEPYIFISYAHDDGDRVYPIIEELARRGYRIWYDEGIEPGSEWIKEISRRISNSAMILFFLSGNFLESFHCKKELSYAATKEKEYIPAFIEQVRLPGDIEYLISTEQQVFRDRCEDLQAFLDKICSCKTMECCRRIPEQVPTASVVRTSVAKQAAAASDVRRKTGVQPAEKQRVPITRRNPAMVAAALAVVLLVLVGIVVYHGFFRSVSLYDDLAVRMNETTLVIRDREVDTDVMSKIKKLDALTSLTFERCRFGEFTWSASYLPDGIAALSFKQCEGLAFNYGLHLDQLVTLEIAECGIRNGDLNERLPSGLRELSLRGNPDLSDLRCLADCKELVSLDISGTAASHLSDIPGAHMQSLDFSHTGVESVEPLSSWKELTGIRGNNTPLISITPLAELEKLVEIEFSGCAILGPAEQFCALRLEKLDLSDNAINQIDAFSDCTILTEVDLSGNELLDVSVLKKSAPTLSKLDLSDNPLKGEDLESLLNACSELTRLKLDGITMKMLPELGHMSKLEWLSASGCGITSMPSLYGLLNTHVLKYVRLSNNHISDLKLLYTSDLVKNITLDLGGNPIDNLLFIPNGQYECLALYHDLIDVSRLSRGIKGKTLVISAGDELTERIDQDAFEKIVLMNCPMDERVRVEDYFGSGRVMFLESEAELIAYMDKLGLDYHFLEN